MYGNFQTFYSQIVQSKYSITSMSFSVEFPAKNIMVIMLLCVVCCVYVGVCGPLPTGKYRVQYQAGRYAVLTTFLIAMHFIPIGIEEKVMHVQGIKNNNSYFFSCPQLFVIFLKIFLQELSLIFIKHK